MYGFIFILWFAIEMINRVPFWLSLFYAAFMTIVAIVVLTAIFWAFAALGWGTYGIVQLFKKLF